jgi:hypothetical protein
MYRPILLTVATAASLVAGSMIAHGRDGVAPVASRALEATDARAGAASRVDDAVAAALIGSISGQFDTDDVTVQLADVQLMPVSLRDREVQGAGRLRIDGDPRWIPFRFAALYDTVNAEVSQPRLRLGTAAVAGTADARIAEGLQARVARALAAEFAGQPVNWTQGATQVAAGDGRFVRVSGIGTADFGVEGQVDARVEALYDRESGRWLRVSYELGEPIDSPATGGAIASL